MTSPDEPLFSSSSSPLETETLVPAESPAETRTLGAIVSRPAAAASDRIHLPGYDVLGEVGRGGMGVVYKARHTKLNRIVAVKMILSGGHAGTADLTRFRTEGEAIARLQHPNIVQVFEVGEHDGLPFFALEFCGGGSLEKKLNGVPLPAREAATLVETLARAMATAHQKGVIHRDLKPANVLFGEDGSLKITDFGLAKVLGETGHTASGAVMGTPSYMAPEQAAGGSVAVGPAADVYALGAIFYESLTGRPPFRGPLPLDTVLQVLSDDPVSPVRLQPKTPRDLETICLHCLQKTPERRYPSAAALADDLRRFLEGQPIRARATSIAEKAVKWGRRRPAAAALIGVICLGSILLAGVITLYNQRLQEQRDYAQDQERIAKRERDAAVAAHLESEGQRQRAEAYFRKARAAVDQMLTEVGETRLANVPQMEPVRQRLLAEALRLYQEFAREKSDDPSLRAEAARAAARVGEIQKLLGHDTEADQAYREATTRAEKLVQDFPDEPDYGTDLAGALNNWGELFSSAGRLKELEEVLNRSLAIWERLTAAHPKNLFYRSQQVTTVGNLGALYRETGRFEQAERAYREVLTDAERLAAANPNEASYLHVLSSAHFHFGVLLDQTHHSLKAEESFRKAAAVSDALLERSPNNAEYRRAQGRAYNSLGMVLGNLGKFAAAEEALKKSLECKSRLTADYPRVPLYAMELLNTKNALGNVYYESGQYTKALAAYEPILAVKEERLRERPNDLQRALDFGGGACNVGNALAKLGRPEPALKLYSRAIETLEGVLRRQPRYVTARTFLCNAREGRITPLLALKRYAEAVEAIDGAIALADGSRRRDLVTERGRMLLDVYQQLRELVTHADRAKGVTEAEHLGRRKDATGDGQFAAACILALAAGSARKDTKLAETERKRLAGEYATSALGLLGRAAANGYFRDAGHVQQLKKNADLQELRSQPEFQELVENGR
jgi:tetratricopeptide (TPR) repeat protein/tRNA A-37 threonylcarbamoyl transferase component Bud32